MRKDSKIVVIAGGISGEREISLRSGRACFAALDRKGYNVSLLDIQCLEQLIELKTAGSIEYAFLCTHGNFGEDGKLQSVLEWLKIPYTGSKVLASAICMNKFFTKQILKANNIESARGSLLSDINKESLNFPLMLKTLESGSSIGVAKVNSLEDLEDQIFKMPESLNEWMIEDFMEGREITVSLLKIQNKLTVLPILEIKSKNEFYDLEAKYTKGLTEFILPAPLEKDLLKKIESIAIRCFRALNCKGYARVDMIISKAGPSKIIVLELNTLPGMTDTSDLPAQAKEAGIEFDDLVELMLQTAS